MQSPDPVYLMAEADQLLESAQKELNKAEEDVVVPLVCYNSRRSLANMLRAYLMKTGTEPGSHHDLSILLEACRENDTSFQNLDLTCMECHCAIKEDEYCTSLDQVKACMDIAKKAKKLVMSEE